MDNSPLGKISPELRNIISGMVLQHEEDVLVISHQCRSNGKPSYRHHVNGRENPFALAHTCRQARAECTSMYYAINQFIIEVSSVNYGSVCAIVQDFTKSGEVKFKSCSARLDLDCFGDEDLLTTLRDTNANYVTRAPHARTSDALGRLDMVTQTMTILGESRTLVWSRKDFSDSVLANSKDLWKLLIGTGGFDGGTSRHGPRCSIRAARVVLYLEHCLLEQIRSENIEAQLLGQHEQSVDELIALTEAGIPYVEDYIARHLRLKDVPCADHACQSRN